MPLQRLIEGAVHDLVRRFREDPVSVKRCYDRLAHLQPQLGLLEIGVSGANRMIANVEDGEIHLLDVGGHETVPRYSHGKYFTDKHQREAALVVFWPDKPRDSLQFFSSVPSQGYAQFGNECSPDWLYFLSGQQDEVLNETLEHVFQDCCEGGLAPVFIVGGPGTGKTSILINLLKQSVELGKNARILCSRRMKEFVIASTGIEDELLVCDPHEMDLAQVELLLVDDPDTKEQVIQRLRDWKDRKHGLAVVVGFDPCQIQDFDPGKKTSGLDDGTFDALVHATHANVFGLDECYRQKENVGTATQKALRVLGESTPFLADHKIEEFRGQHVGVNSLGQEFSFPNPHGYVEVYREWSIDDLYQEVARIKSRSTWTHWPSTLIILDDQFSSDAERFRSMLFDHGVSCDAVQLSDVGYVKGLEYQHLILFIAKSTFEDLENGFQGSGQALYAKYRLMRIPLSRPKDSQVVFVMS